MATLLVPAALAAYIVGLFLAAVSTFRSSRGAHAGSLASLSCAWALHLGAIVHQGLATRRLPVGNAGEFLLVLGWVVLTLHLVVTLRSRVAALEVVLPPLAAIMMVPALWLPARQTPPESAERTLLLNFHTTTATAGMAALALAFAVSVIYLVQDHALKSKQLPALLGRFPSLATCDRIGMHAILWGFPLLTLGIVTGAIWSLDVHGRAWIGGAKQVFPVLAWIVFAGLLYARLARGVGGRRSAWVTIAGFGLSLLTILGMTI